MSAASGSAAGRPVVAMARNHETWLTVARIAFAVGGGVLAARAFDRPILILAALAGLALVAGVMLYRRSHGTEATWVAAISLSILAGELSAISFGGQSGRLLWADAVLFVGVAWGVASSGFRLEIPRAHYLGGLAALIAWSALTLMPARDVLTGIAELKEWVVALVVAIVAARFANGRSRARQLLAIVAFTGSLLALSMAYVAFTSPFGPVLVVLLKKVDLPYGRTNYLAGMLILALPLALGLMGSAARLRSRILWLGVLLCNAMGIVLSASKGAITALAIGLVIAYGRGGKSVRHVIAIMGMVLAVAVSLFVFGPLRQVVQYRLQASALDYSAEERIDLYRLAWSEFTHHPLLGIGLNNFSVAANRLRGVDTVPHNLELGFLAELGLPGLILALFWIATLGAVVWRARTSARAPADQSLAIALWAAFVAFVTHNQFESTIYGEQFKILLMLFAAAAWRLSLGDTSEANASIGAVETRTSLGESSQLAAKCTIRAEGSLHS